MCGKALADIHGIHTLSCMSGGARTHLHNRVRDVLADLGRRALAEPFAEARPFSDIGASLRIDLHFRAHRMGNPQRPVVADVAVVNATSSAHRAAAVLGPGKAATAYEAVKRAKYGAAAERDGFCLVPAIVDVFGGWSDAAVPLIKSLATRWGKRLDMAPGRAIPAAFRMLSATVARGVASMLRAQIAPDALSPVPASFEGPATLAHAFGIPLATTSGVAIPPASSSPRCVRVAAGDAAPAQACPPSGVGAAA
jgi:hypothetical protein